MKFGIAFFLVWSVLPVLSLAHEIRPAIVDVNVDQDGGHSVQINLNLEAMLADIGIEHSDTDESENSLQYNRFRSLLPAELEKAFNKFSPAFLDSLHVEGDSGKVRYQISDVLVPAVGNLKLARDSKIVMAPEDSVQTLTWSWGERFGPVIVRLNQPNQDETTEGFSQYLEPGERSESLTLLGDNTRNIWRVVTDYLKIGFTHIVPKGLDHILFVVGLFLLSPAWRPLLWQVTAFTLAHTVTLALGISGKLVISPSIVEPLIALSIVYVCVENLFVDRLRKGRTLIVFLFGLLHGLGFAGVLKEVGIEGGNFITSLISFNVGVELGQLLVIAICYVTVGIWFSKKDWYRSLITVPASIVIAAIGVYWFIDRTMF
ncbi:MAG: HupE/UreJ family protein [Pseudomonadota bacterium]